MFSLFTAGRLPRKATVHTAALRAAAAGLSVLVGLSSAAMAAPGSRTRVAHPARTGNPEAIITTSMGNIKVELFPKVAPIAVSNFIGLATGKKAWTDPRTGQKVHRPLYNGTLFHRVIPGFMIQGGDPLGTGMGGPGYGFGLETGGNLHFDHPGYLAMAHSSLPDSNGSQFFITVAAAPWLDGQYTIFGKVLSGQDVADKIALVARDPNDRPLRDVVIEKVTILPAK